MNSRYVLNYTLSCIAGHSALHPSGVAKSSTSFGWGKGWNVTSAGWQVTLCDPIWHVSSSSGEATSVSELLYPCYFTYFYFKTVKLVYYIRRHCFVLHCICVAMKLSHDVEC